MGPRAALSVCVCVCVAALPPVLSASLTPACWQVCPTSPTLGPDLGACLHLCTGAHYTNILHPPENLKISSLPFLSGALHAPHIQWTKPPADPMSRGQARPDWLTLVMPCSCKPPLPADPQPPPPLPVAPGHLCGGDQDPEARAHLCASHPEPARACWQAVRGAVQPPGGLCFGDWALPGGAFSTCIIAPCCRSGAARPAASARCRAESRIGAACLTLGRAPAASPTEHL